MRECQRLELRSIRTRMLRRLESASSTRHTAGALVTWDQNTNPTLHMNLTEHRARLQQADEKVDKGKADGAAEERSDTSLDPNQGTHKRAPDSWTHMLLRFLLKTSEHHESFSLHLTVKHSHVLLCYINVGWQQHRLLTSELFSGRLRLHWRWSWGWGLPQRVKHAAAD